MEQRMMKAGYWDGPYSMTVKEVPMDELKDDQVRIRVAYCGICENDVWISSGEFFEVQPPAILGHEFSGKIVEVGPNVKHYKVGDRVACNMQVFCGTCWYCHNGFEHFCEHKDMATGAYAQYSIVSEKACEHMPDDMTYAHAAFLEVTAAAMYSVERANVTMGRSCAVFGGGTKAQLEMIIAKKKGAYPVICIDPSKLRRDKALEMGVDYAIDPSTQDVKEEINRITHGHGVDNIIESSCIVENIQVACDIAAPCATINLAANYLPGTKVTFDLWQIRLLKQLSIHTSLQSPYLFERTMEFLPNIEVEKLTTAIRPLDELNDAFIQQRDHEEFKILIKPWDEDFE